VNSKDLLHHGYLQSICNPSAIIVGADRNESLEEWGDTSLAEPSSSSRDASRTTVSTVLEEKPRGGRTISRLSARATIVQYNHSLGYITKYHPLSHHPLTRTRDCFQLWYIAITTTSSQIACRSTNLDEFQTHRIHLLRLLPVPKSKPWFPSIQVPESSLSYLSRTKPYLTCQKGKKGEEIFRPLRFVFVSSPGDQSFNDHDDLISNNTMNFLSTIASTPWMTCIRQPPQICRLRR
jgi:hypothetical protein